MKSFWKAFYYDGRTAERHEVEISLSPEALCVKKDGKEALWRLDEVDQTQGFNKGEPVRLEKGGEALIINDAEFVVSLYSMAPAHAARFKRPDRMGRGVLLISLAAFLTIAIGLGVYFWAIPAMVRVATANIPPSVEDRLGRSYVSGLTGMVPQCTSPEIIDSTDRILKKLESAVPGHPYDFKLYVLKNETVNAFAAPGGHIVLLSGLIEATESPEELAGVMAHEMQHVLKKHSTQAIFKDLSTGVLFSFAFGDLQGLSGAVRTMEGLRYGRNLEEEADKKGMELLVRAGIDPEGMVGFFEYLWECECKKEKKDKKASVLEYLSTHPATENRVEYLKKNLGSVSPRNYEPLLPGVDWERVKNSCSGGPPGGKEKQDEEAQKTDEVDT